ncbi:MAG: ATP-binding protein [Acidimicrobiia bacterium]|nr:ATP-binding protein [Acidimicrobiia bacterium]
MSTSPSKARVRCLHSPAVSTECCGRFVHHSIASDADKPLIFTRFFRAESTRSMPGSGLGLSIVKQFADDHAAEISVLDTAGGGATFVLRLAAD